MEEKELSRAQCFWILAAFFSIAAAIIVFCCRERPEFYAAQAQADTVMPMLKAGQVTALDSGQHLLASSSFLCNEISQLRRAGDRIGLQKLINNELAFLIEGQAQVLVIDVDLLGEWVRVRILNGQDTGRDGWVRDYEVAR